MPSFSKFKLFKDKYVGYHTFGLEVKNILKLPNNTLTPSTPGGNISQDDPPAPAPGTDK